MAFTGLCRDDGGTLAALELEHYPGMAEAEITRIAKIAMERFGLLGLTAIHRHGKIEVHTDRDVPYGVVKKVLYTARAAGVNEIALVGTVEAGF